MPELEVLSVYVVLKYAKICYDVENEDIINTIYYKKSGSWKLQRAILRIRRSQVRTLPGPQENSRGYSLKSVTIF